MADNLIFPVKFDLEAAVRKAQGEADKYLRQLENTLRQKPIKLDVAIDGAAPGSIDSISKRMSALSQEFNKLAEAQRVYNRASGEFTPEAQKIIKEYAELTAATQTYAQSLSQITAAAKRQTQEQMKAQEQEIKRYEEYWKRKEAENAKQAQQEVANAERARKAQQQRISQEQAADAKRYQEWLRQKNQEVIETERVERQKQQSRERTIAQQNREFAAQRQAEQQRQQAISASLRTEYQRIEAKKQAEAASRRELQMLNQQYAAEERRQRLAASQASIAKRQQVIKTLRAEENTIVNITAKLQHWQQVMNSSAMDGRQFRRAAEEVQRLSQKLSEAQARISQLTTTTSNASARQSAAVRQVSQEFKNQDGYVSRLLKRMAVYAGFSMISGFLTNVREVTAQFELQRISLGAIIQDQAKANALFSEIKNFALKSPIKILDLTKYTKQLAAYKIGVNELFDTTKRLADISVGIGVSMDRLILLYGQVRATGYLRASEIRQATEAGIPLVEELANKLSEANGTLVTSAQVLKMVEGRAISFEMVKEVFEDMTNAGGLFYDMQEKQGNTLYGMWQKLGDAAAMMYDEIGNTPWVNEGMKEAINMLRTLMIEWKRAGANIATLGVAMLLYANKAKLATLASNLAIAANEKGTAALNARIAALKRLIIHQKQAVGTTNAVSASTRVLTAAHLRASQAINLVVAGFKKLKAAFMSNIWGIALVGLSLLIEHLIFAKDQAKELKNELANINLDYESKQGQDAANLEYLANAAVNAAKGSKAQKDALEELKNTYGKIIPMELLTIENLERMKGNYGELIALIDEYNLKQKYEKETSAIESSFAPKEEERANKIRNILRDGLRLDYADEATGGVFDKVLDLSERNIQRFLLNLKKYADEGLDKKEQIIRASADLAAELGLNEGETEALTNAMIDLDRHELEGQGTLMDYTEALHQKHEAMEEVTNDYEKQKKALNEYSAVVDEVLKKNEEEPEVTANKDEFENEKARLNNQISDVASGIVELLNKANVAVDNGTQQILNTVIQNGGMIPDAVWDILEKAAEAANNPKLLAAIQDLRKHYKGLAPNDETVNFVKNGFIKIVSAAQGQMKEYRQYLYDGKTTIKEYQDNLQKSIQGLRAQIYQMVNLNNLIDAGLVKGQKYDEATIKALQERADNLQVILDQFVTPLVIPDEKKKGGRQSDPRLQNLKEEISLYEKLYQEYKQYEKAVGSSKAAEYMNREAKDTIDALAKKYGIGLPKNVTDLTSALEMLYNKMQALPSKVFKNLDKELKEFRWKIEKVDIDESQKNIEAELKRIADRISRTKTAKEFYEKILGMSGDHELAMNVAVQIYGSNGKELDEKIKEQFRLAFATLDKPDVEVSAKIGDLIDKGRYEELRDYIALLPEAQRKTAEDLVKAQQQMSAKQYEQWLKDLEKAKDYADKRIELSRYTANQIAAIEERIAKLDPAATDYEQQKEMLQKLIDGYKNRESKEAAGLEYEQFKNSALYVQVFENLDNASKTALENMRNRLIALKDQWKNLSPQQVKELTKRLEELDAQIAQRNPFKSIADSIKKLRDMRMGGRTKEGDAQKAFDAEQDRLAAEAKMIADEKAYEAAVKQYGAESDIAKAKRKIADDSAEAYRKAEKMADNAAENADEWEKVAEAINAANQKLDKYQEQINEALSGVREIMESFGASSEDMQFFDDVTNGFNEIFDAGQQGAEAYASFMLGDFVGATRKGISAVGSLISGVTNLFYAGRVKRANKEIKRQQELLEQLEYTYGRLENAADKVFGRDYVNNYNQQLKNLQAQQQAYLKQAEAERSKGKKKDKEKIKEYEEQARETADKIKELQDDLVAHFTGSSKTDVARQMAKSWIDARASMSDTFAAIKGDYQDLIKNMIVEGAAARVIENALTPVWNNMQKMLEKNDVQGAIDSLIGGMDAALSQANNGMEVLWKALEARGYDMKKLISDTDSEYTGIAKSVAGATSEEILQLSGFVNTALYYIAPIPRIDENLARVVAIMEGKTAALPTASGGTTGAIDYTDMFTTANQHLSSLPRMEQHLAEIHTMLGRALKTKGSTTGFNTFLNS